MDVISVNLKIAATIVGLLRTYHPALMRQVSGSWNMRTPEEKSEGRRPLSRNP